jgi:SAM-dependent methyltransferase
MLNWVKGEVRRFRRSVAQGGLRSAVGHVAWRLTHPAPVAAPEPDHPSEPHPFDVAAGVDTSGVIHGSALAAGHPHDAYIVAYYGSAPSLFRAAMERWKQTPAVRPVSEYTFVDIGCGKGRALMMASEMGFRECVGVELIEDLAMAGRANLEHFAATGRARSPMRIVRADALELEYPQTPCLVFLFNPFTGRMLTRLLKKIATVFRDRPGEVEIVYLNSRYRDELIAEPGFEMLWEEALEMTDEEERLDREYMGEKCSAWRWVGV